MQQLDYVRKCRAQSRWYRWLLTAAVIYAVLRFALQLVMLTGVMMPVEAPNPDLAMPDDLRLYLEAIDNLQRRENLYPPVPLEYMELYQYPPAFALILLPLIWFPPVLVAFVATLLHVVIYALLYWRWGRIFERLGLEQGSMMLAWTLPVWLVFATFWSDLGYLNIYILMALLGTLVIESVLFDRLGWAVLWFSIAVHTKPQWALLAALPLLLGRSRFFFRLVLFSLGVYVATAAVTIVAVGLPYGWEQYRAYFELLASMGSGNFPWRGPEMPFLGYNHSIMQILVYLLGESSTTITLAVVVKALALVPLGLIGLRCLRRPLPFTPQNSLDAAFALYLAAFVWLDVVWELSLGIVVFGYLLATLPGRRMRVLIWAVFLPYALVDVIQLVSYLVFGDAVIAPGPYVLTDISIYLPVVMIVTLVFYALLVRRLWPVAFAPQALPHRREARELS